MFVDLVPLNTFFLVYKFHWALNYFHFLFFSKFMGNVSILSQFYPRFVKSTTEITTKTLLHHVVRLNAEAFSTFPGFHGNSQAVSVRTCFLLWNVIQYGFSALRKVQNNYVQHVAKNFNPPCHTNHTHNSPFQMKSQEPVEWFVI